MADSILIPETAKIGLFGSPDQLIAAKKQAKDLGLRVQLRDASAFNPDYGIDSQFKTIVLLGSGPHIERVREAYKDKVRVLDKFEHLLKTPEPEKKKPKSIKQSEHPVDTLP